MPPADDAPTERRAPTPAGIILRLLLLALVVLALNRATFMVIDSLSIEMRPSSGPMVRRLLTVAALFYALLLAVPFVPGAEVGMALLGVLGPRAAPLVYLATLGGLTLAFCAGRLIRPETAGAWCRRLRLRRLADRVEHFAEARRDGRGAELDRFVEGRLSAFLVRHRFLALAVLLNLPGNVVIGGGGGLAFLAGVSRLYSWQGFLVTIALAVAPVPLAILLFGTSPF